MCVGWRGGGGQLWGLFRTFKHMVWHVEGGTSRGGLSVGGVGGVERTLRIFYTT